MDGVEETFARMTQSHNVSLEHLRGRIRNLESRLRQRNKSHNDELWSTGQEMERIKREYELKIKELIAELDKCRAENQVLKDQIVKIEK